MITWTRDLLNDFVRTKLGEYRFIAVSNREPFQHRKAGKKIECIQPASGMASALDPVMRASGGLWIAHGSGDADQLTVDNRSHVCVPPDAPEYTLRRIWLSQEEQQGHYAGLSNEGLWPLCHVAFTRPVFSPEHWEMYRRVNQRFADAVLDEVGTDPAFVFIQDYHFALLPRLLRNANPNLVIAQFWHIPWPNSEVFNAFPWREEILDGLLGNDLIGFHLPHHCQNFIHTVDCSLEARVDSGVGEICQGGHSTVVRPFPIGIDYEKHALLAESEAVDMEMRRWRHDLQLSGKVLGVGIDRLDYTKGIPERLRYLNRLFEMYPAYRGKLVFVQIAVPSRTNLPAYRQLEAEVDMLVGQINRRWRHGNYRPIVLLKRHYETASMVALHRLASFCIVSALHDGMNLVAKEFVASRTDGDGVLILSKFAGAARELKDALHINPFAVEEGMEAIVCALAMSRSERERRMARMRESVEQNNVYRWAGSLLSELTQLRSAPPAAAELQPQALSVAV